MLIVLALLVAGGLFGYQISKPCDKSCFDEKIKEISKEEKTKRIGQEKIR